jgi:N-acyl-D-aspartate/D-glutamate deacylase
MEGVEDIPFPVLSRRPAVELGELSRLPRRPGEPPFDVDIGSQLPHAALRVYVMGQRGVDREPATEADINAMAAIAKRAMEAGAIGFGTSRTLNHAPRTARRSPRSPPARTS